MNARLFRYASVGAMLALSLGSALPTLAATPKPVSPAGPASTASRAAPSAPLAPPAPGAPPATDTVIYNSLPIPQGPNVPSLGYAATSTREFGDHITFAGTARKATKVTVLMSAWAKKSLWPSVGDATGFMHQITLNLYNVVQLTPTIVSNLATVTQNFKIPWRPESDLSCPTGDYGAGFAWRSDSDGVCYNGYAFNIVFDLTSLNLILPNEIIYGIAYNTQSSGVAPLGTDGPYNSLNFGVANVVPSVGTDNNLDDVIWNTSYGPFYTDGGFTAVGTFRQDTNWSGYVPNVRFEATPPELYIAPTDQTVASGSPFNVKLGIKNVQGLYGYELTLSHDPAMATGVGTRSYLTSFFAPDFLPLLPGPCTSGVCKFGANLNDPTPAVSGSGDLAQVAFAQAGTPGVYTLSYSLAKLSAKFGVPIPSVQGTAQVTVTGLATIKGKVKLQGRATPMNSGIITMTDVSGYFADQYGTFDLLGDYSLVVPVMPGGTTYRIAADHTLYLYNVTAGASNVTVVPADVKTASTTTLTAGDANNDEKVDLSDLQCIATDFGGAPTGLSCYGTPPRSPDLNNDLTVDIFDLVLAGSNYLKVSPQPWP